MLSTCPATLPSDVMLGNPFPAFDVDFTPWDCPELFSALQSPKPAVSSSDSDKPNQNTVNSNSGSDEPNRTDSFVDERKRRRMISNRESARRSRMRKQKHLENLRNQVTRLRIQNRNLSNRLRYTMYHCKHIRTDNDRLQSEYTMLRQRLSDIHQFFVFRQLQQFSSAWPCAVVTSEQTHL